MRRSDAVVSRWARATILGLLVAVIAVVLRLQLRTAIGGDQAIFSYPAIAVATLLFGARAGIVTAIACFLPLWYFVIPPRHSFAVEDAQTAISLAIYLGVGTALIWSIGGMRRALNRYRDLNVELERIVDDRTAERNRLWQRSRELLAIIDEGGRIQAANPALCEMAALDDAQLKTRRFGGLLADDDRQAYRSARDRGEGVFEARLKTAGDPAWVSWSLVREADRFYLVGRDFTAEHVCGEQLRQSQKMELVGQMAGGLAHDFGNLMPPVSMILHLLGKRHADDPRTRELIGAAEKSVDRADQLIKRLLALSRPSRPQLMTRSTDALLEEVAPLLHQAAEGREFLLRVRPGLPPIQVDANQLDMALLNLVLNARDATAGHGVLELTADASDGQVEITVADDGPGMDPETLARATEPFFSTKASGEGTGLGLPMVHNFAIAAGGRLSIDSAAGRGTRATITLPAAPRVEAAAQAVVSTAGRSSQ